MWLWTRASAADNPVFGELGFTSPLSSMGWREGLTPEEIIDHYPQLNLDDIRAALAYAAELSRQNLWKVTAGP